MIKMRSSVLRGLWVAISLLLFISVAAPTSVEAKMDLPPLLNSEDEIRQYMESVKEQLPEIIQGRRPLRQSGGNDAVLLNMVRREQSLLRRLISQPEYMRLVEERPNLQITEIRQVRVVQSNGQGLRGWDTFLREEPWPVGEAQRLAELRESLQGLTNHSSSGFFAAVAQAIPEKSKNDLKDPNLRSRWRALRPVISRTQNLGRLREILRSSAFGLPQNWSLDDLDRLVDEMAKLEDRVIFLVQILLNPSTRSQDSWLLDEESVESLEDFGLGSRELKLLENLRNRSRKRFLDPRAIIETEQTEKMIRLREAPPNLAIYRGCVGSDCSTDSSWSYPYSPYERYWWIETENGVRLGYVSGAITTLNHRPCLYIRDVTGPGLTNGDVTMILNGLFMAKGFYGVDQMTIMPLVFISQNHFEFQRGELHRYPSVRPVIQEFQDRWIRDQYLVHAETSAQYDSIQVHQNARLVNPQAGLESLRVNQLDMNSQSSNNEFFWMALNEAARTGRAQRLVDFNSHVDWQEVIEALKNSQRLPANEYYASVIQTFRRHDLPMSRNLIKKHQDLFIEGHLQSADAFTNEKARKNSVRYLHDLIWRLGKRDLAAPFIEQNQAVLENDPSWRHALESLFERRGVEDVQRFLYLWDLGCRFTGIHLDEESASWVIGFAESVDLVHWAIEQVSADGEISDEVALAIASRLENADESIPEEVSIWVAEKYYEWPEFILRNELIQEEAKASLESEDNVQILMPLALAYVRDMPADDPFMETAKTVIRDNLQDETVPRRLKTAARRLLGSDCENRLNTRRRGRNAP